jgi:(p)ppGpp synthase/HD superfamily hydrolase
MLPAVRVAQPPLRAEPAVAIDFLLGAYAGVAVRPGKGLPHAQAVADVLREAGADERTQLAGLLHDVVEETPLSVDDVRAAFGESLATMVAALTEDESIKRYAQRKRGLRSQIAGAEPTVMDIALADKVAALRHAALTRTPISQRKLTHYRATLRLGLAAGASPPLTAELERLFLQVGARPSP